MSSHDNNIVDLVYAAIEALGEGDEKLGPRPLLLDVKGEWIAARPEAETPSSDASLATEETFKKMAETSTHKPTILYIHGGTF